MSRPAGRPSREHGTNMRALGLSPRQLGRQPRATGAAPNTTLAGIAARVARTRALAERVLSECGLSWCERCDGSGWLPVAAGGVERCDCPKMPPDVAERIASRFGHYVTDRRDRADAGNPYLAQRIARIAGLPIPST